MTIVKQSAATPQEVVDRARELGPEISRRAAEVEAARRVPPDLLGELIGAGCFRVFLPRSHGGVGADLPSGIRVFETLAEADASVAWTVMIGAGAWCDVAGLPRSTFDALYADTPDVIIAGAINPAGSIARVDHGYRVSGRWSFVSGCEHADWICGNCVEGIVDGVPQLRMAVFSPDEIVIEDTWTVSGLCGTGSHHFHADDVIVPADRTLRPLDDEPCIDEAITRIPSPQLFSLMIASVAIGTAQGALNDVLALAERKVPLFTGAPLAANPLFQLELATADTELRAARALLYDTAQSTWTAAADGQPFMPKQRARIRAAAVWVATRAAVVVDTAYRSGGGSSVYADSPLQRRQRDIHALTQHFLVRRDTMTTAGAILAGQDVTVMVF